MSTASQGTAAAAAASEGGRGGGARAETMRNFLAKYGEPTDDDMFVDQTADDNGTVDPSIVPISGSSRTQSLPSIQVAFLRVYQYRSKSLLLESEIEAMLSLTPFMSRYAGFLFNYHDVPNHISANGGGVIDKKKYHSREQVFLLHSRTKELLGMIVYKGYCEVLMNLVNSSPGGTSSQEVRKVAGWAFSAIEVASRCLLTLTNTNYTPTGTSTDRLYGRGEIFGSLFSLSRCLWLCKHSIDRTSASIHEYITDLCRYMNAFGTALLRVVVMHEEYIRTMLLGGFDTHPNGDLDRVRMATQYALLKCVYNINKEAATKQPVHLSKVCDHKGMMEDLFKYNTLTRNKLYDEGMLDNTYLTQSVRMSLAQCKSICDINGIVNRLAADCRSTDNDIMSGLMPGHCDTNFPTIKSELPCSSVITGGSGMVGAAANAADDENLMHNIVDPATSTSLYMHNMMHLESQDTIPVYPSTANYSRLKTMNAQVGKIGALPLIVHGLNGEIKSREERYFYQNNTNSKDMVQFYFKGCSVSPSNICLFMRCLNFEMMDSKTFNTIIEAMKSCDGLPRPSDMSSVMMNNGPCMRIAMNIFYRHYMSETTDSPVMHCWDNKFFKLFNHWWWSNEYAQGTISYRSAQLFIAGTILFASNMPRISGGDGGVDTPPVPRVVLSQQACGHIMDQAIKDMMEDDSEVTVLPKGLLEKELLVPFAGRFQGDYLTTRRFLDAPSFRLFLSKCFFNFYGDGMKFMCPTGEIEFLLHLLKETTSLDISEPGKRNARTLNAMINNATKTSIEAGRNLSRVMH